jgi:hypothetical protein
MTNYIIILSFLIISVILFYMYTMENEEGFAGGWRRRLANKVKEKGKEKIIEYLEKKAKQYPRMIPVVNTLKNDKWVYDVAAKIRANPEIITLFSLAKQAASSNYSPEQMKQLELQIQQSPQLQKALITLQSDPTFTKHVKFLLAYPVVREIADELASNNSASKKTRNIIKIVRGWLRSTRRPNETSVEEDDIQANDIPQEITQLTSMMDSNIKIPLPPLKHDDFEQFADYHTGEWSSQFDSLNPKKAWNINTQINMPMH